jgi:hypothetical protein
LSFLATEQKQIEGEIFSLGNEQGLSLKMDDLKDGKVLLDREVSVLRASCIAMIADLKNARETELERDQRLAIHRRYEVIVTRILLGLFVAASAIGGTYFGWSLRAQYSKQDRDYIDQKLRAQVDNQRRMSEQLNALHRSNRKIAFWTEKTTQQIDAEISDVQSRLKKEVADIREETARKIAMVESEYARSGRDGDVELDRRKQSLIKLRDRQIDEAQDRARQAIRDLQEQKENIQR